MSKSFPTIIITALLALPSAARAENAAGNLSFDLVTGLGGGKEMLIQEPEMCEGESRTKITWNRNQDRVRIKLELEGIPYKPSYCFEEDPSTPYNEYPMCVEDGGWQMWVLPRIFTRTSVWYYDADSGDLIGNEFDLPEGPPPGSIPFELPAVQMMCMGYFQPNPVTLKFNGHFDFDYDHMLDGMGTPGSIVTAVPFNAFDENSYWYYYTHAVLPDSEAVSWDDTLDDLAGGNSIMIATSVEPEVKPASLATHDQLMIGWAAGYPAENFPAPLEDCETTQLDLTFPPGPLPS